MQLLDPTHLNLGIKFMSSQTRWIEREGKQHLQYLRSDTGEWADMNFTEDDFPDTCDAGVKPNSEGRAFTEIEE